jgi:transposase
MQGHQVLQEAPGRGRQQRPGCRNRSVAGQPRQAGSKHHLICDGNGTPLLVLTSGANVPDISRAVDLLDLFQPVVGRPGRPRPRRRFAVLLVDKGYDSEAFRATCRERGTQPIIPNRRTTAVKGLGKPRYVVEQTFALLHQFRRLAVRWERCLDIHDGFVS